MRVRLEREIDSLRDTSTRTLRSNPRPPAGTLSRWERDQSGGVFLGQRFAPIARQMADEKLHLIGQNIAVGENQMLHPARPVWHGQ